MSLFSRVATAAALLASVAGVSQAQTTTVQGSTFGCFDTGCTPTSIATDGTPFSHGLIFTGTNFGPQTISASSSSIFLGTIGVEDGTYTNQAFTLQTVFSAPVGAGSQVFTAALNGHMGIFGNNLMLAFDGPQTFNVQGGQMTFSVDDIDFGFPDELVGEVDHINGNLTYTATTTTPEPSSMALLGTGLIGLVPMVRRRRK